MNKQYQITKTYGFHLSPNIESCLMHKVSVAGVITRGKRQNEGFDSGPDLALWGPRAPRYVGAPLKMKTRLW